VIFYSAQSAAIPTIKVAFWVVCFIIAEAISNQMSIWTSLNLKEMTGNDQLTKVHS
jgi:hypothetical protein